ncbi:MAG: hypothetical protein IJ228_02505 [Succinivibrio sp.]|nr:hypothetical protein [Succinivibrio sp.]
MACFTAAVAEALVVYGVKKTVEHHTQKTGVSSPWPQRLALLFTMLVGGSLLLAVEHVWHGEIVPWYPFLTALNSPEDTSAMLHEILTVGVSMDIVITALWAGVLWVKSLKAAPAAQVTA